MKDRFYNGFISGLLGGVVPFAFNYGSHALGFSTLVWADFMGAFIMGKRPENILEMVFFVGVQFVFLGLLGAIFALILPLITSKHYLFKGALYGATVWFIVFSFPYLLQLPDLAFVPLRTSVTHVISAALWGITLAFILKRLDNRALHQQ
jgi:uncharacterized membrane protein YagU involved in acid resistance